MEKLKVKLTHGGIFKTSDEFDSGYDVCAVGYARITLDNTGKRIIGETVRLKDNEQFIVLPHETIMIKTGVHLGQRKTIEYEHHYELIEAETRPRSGISLKEHSNVKLGTIDNLYTGEIGVIFINDGNTKLSIKKYERIAQIVLNRIIKYKKDCIEFVESLDETDRGSNGFGSTGK